ncbi:dTDP-4-dehydrorhamnose reductase [Carboxylicivirga sp. A043]|uniref:dTDP-4-dehydrorhamnose reductase n=1 Tax=Carboxylicivirga litoralis TaxID=2816963 RepID=UPI0021CB42F7|nr:dTDP-4-dehydrorhamnose reductase [Carboxylicivirga sp. A043]MCU4156890.1 dTDP-4-dehydrorhamnose reductase [Carboxylicivirga sp. A043]
MKQILVIGSEGQLGSEIKDRCKKVDNAQFSFTSLETLDVTNTEDLTKTIKAVNYSYIINCTAYTAVDKAESEKDLAIKINTTAVEKIGEAAQAINAKVIHISTDYVFDGNSHFPYKEDAATAPQSVYGATKLSGEKHLMESNPNSIIIRTSWLYSANGNNFVKTMIRLGQEREELGVIFDQIGTPTYAGDLADAILHIIESDMSKSIPFVPGIYHYSNEGVVSWYDFTLAILEKMNISCRVKPIETKDYPTPAPRPHYSVLNKAKIKETYNLAIPYWRDSLDICLSKIK